MIMVLSLLRRLSGLSPFLGETDAETMNFIVNCSWDFDADTFEGLSEDAKDFVSQLLVKEKRYLCCLPFITHSDGDHRSRWVTVRCAGRVCSSCGAICPRFLSLSPLWGTKAAGTVRVGDQQAGPL